MRHIDHDFFKELSKLVGDQKPLVKDCILEIAMAKNKEHLKISNAFKEIRKVLQDFCDEPSLDEIRIFADQIATEAKVPREIIVRFRIRVAIYLKEISDAGSDTGETHGEAPAHERAPQRRKSEPQR